jgi:peptidoglycan/xylan/chitin deacetylase (PgdA/CDA1 family)
MKVLILYILCLFPLVSHGQDKRICITVDDLPVVSYTANDPELDEKITTKLIGTFNHYKIPAIGYVNEGKLYQRGQLDPAKVNLLRAWLKNGYDLGNHTFSHYDYHKVPDSVYFQDILKGESIIRPLMKEYKKDLIYFRHPFLRTGETRAKSDSLTNFLRKHGYTTAPVTFDNDDYLFAKAYHNAYLAIDKKVMKKVGSSYILYMEKKLIFFEQKSKELFNRNITQTLLIHASLLNADYLDELAKIFKKHGYSFVSQEETLLDPAYSESVNVYYKKGFSWIFRWAFSKGKSNDFLLGDPATPEYIIQLSKK